MYRKHPLTYLYFFCTVFICYMNGMNKNNEFSSALLLPIDKIENFRCVELFSEFCEATCANLFAFSPYLLHLNREEFLHYQFLADELKDDIEKGEIPFEELYNLCCNLNDVYLNLASCCWEAYKYNENKERDPCGFIIRQIKNVAETRAKLEMCKNDKIPL